MNRLRHGMIRSFYKTICWTDKKYGDFANLENIIEAIKLKNPLVCKYKMAGLPTKSQGV